MGAGGTWNRAGRRSGGSRPVDIVARPLTPGEEAAEARRELLDGIARRSVLHCIVGYALAADGDTEVSAAMRRVGIVF